MGPAPALVAVDLYELACQGGAEPAAKLHRSFPSSCGEDAHAAIEPTKRLFVGARAAGLPIFYSTSDVRAESLAHNVEATRRRAVPKDPSRCAIRPEFEPQRGEVVITKQRASAFFRTPLVAHLTQLGVRSIIMCGESTSGCSARRRSTPIRT